MSSVRREIHTIPRVIGACTALLLCALFLTAYSSRNPQLPRIGGRLIAEVSMPISNMVHYIRETFITTIDAYVWLVHTEAENDELREKLSAIQTYVDLAHEFEIENIRLRKLLNLANAYKAETVIAASVIGGDPGGWTHSIAINQGSRSGVAVGMGVIHPRGIVGQVVSVSSHGARVLVFDDPASNVDVLLQERRTRGLLEGAGDGTATIQFIDKDQTVQEGDRVITSGMDMVFPKGLRVGVVKKVSHHIGEMFKVIEVHPSIEFAELEEVLVVNVSKPGQEFDLLEKQ